MKLRSLALLVLLLMATALPVQADEHVDASHAPRTSGPLLGVPLDCEDNGPPPRSGANGQSCSWRYELAPLETNVAEDFSAHWIQIEIDTSPGWCAVQIGFKWRNLEGGRIVSAVPDKSERIANGEQGVTELVVDAEGTAPVPGRIEQDTVIPSGRTKVDWDEDHYSFTWTGVEKDKIVLAIGLEVAHGAFPTGFSYSAREIQSMGMGSCRPMLIRIRPRY